MARIYKVDAERLKYLCDLVLMGADISKYYPGEVGLQSKDFVSVDLTNDTEVIKIKTIDPNKDWSIELEIY